MGVVVRGKKESTINTLCLYPPTILLKGGGKGRLSRGEAKYRVKITIPGGMPKWREFR